MRIVIHSNDPDLSICRYYVPDGTRESEALEEALYVLWELTPTKGLVAEWHDLIGHGTCMFDYHRCEYSSVKRLGEWEYMVNHSGDA